MDDLDMALAQLAGAPISASMEGLEDRVMARVALLNSRRGPSLIVSGAGAAIFALGLGVAMSGQIGRHDAPPQDVASLFGETPYALSKLLGA